MYPSQCKFVSQVCIIQQLFFFHEGERGISDSSSKSGDSPCVYVFPFGVVFKACVDEAGQNFPHRPAAVSVH